MTTLSLLTPSGRLTLGNLLGALRPMAERQQDAYYGISDLHAMTTPHDPALLRERTREMATLLLAAGLERSTLFVQSAVPAHTALGYLLECTAHTGELNRMVQFKEKSRQGSRPVRVSLYTYPLLMAADILLYRPTEVPVGDDQRQHVELTRDLALRFNRTYGEVFTVPRVVTPAAGARVMDLADPTRKMSKSVEGAGSILLLDPPDVVRRKVARAVTDSDTGADAVRADREAKPGVTNLLDVLVACGGSAEGITTYGSLKAAVTDAVVAVL
jgi:tryptophanyl-tRNA synthetase